MAESLLEPQGALVTLPSAFPPIPAVARILSRFDRAQLEGFIAVAIDLADAMDGDADMEPEEDIGEEERGENRTWIEAIDQRRIADYALTYAEMDDDAEEDDPSGVADEDGVNTALQCPHLLSGGPGCPISDPGEHGGRLRKPVYGADQTRPQRSAIWNGKEPNGTPTA